MQTAEVISKEERQGIFLKKFREVPYHNEVAKLLGIPSSTLHEWKTKDIQFRKQFDEIRNSFIGEMVDKAERNVLTAAQEPRQAWLAVRVLEQFSPEWRRTDQNGPIQFNIETAIINPHGPVQVNAQTGTQSSEDGPGQAIDTDAGDAENGPD